MNEITNAANLMEGAEDESSIDGLLAFIKLMTPSDQLDFWRKFRAVHRKRIGDTEAQLHPELLRTVDQQIAALEQHLT